MHYRLISCVLIIIAAVLLFTLIIYDTNSRLRAGFFKKDVIEKDCGWLSSIIWARKTVNEQGKAGWYIYSKSGYVAHDNNTTAFEERMTEIFNIRYKHEYGVDGDGVIEEGYACPELSGRNHLKDIQGPWNHVVASIQANSNEFKALPCMYTFVWRDAGLIEGSIHAAAGLWARDNSIAIARYGNPESIINYPNTYLRSRNFLDSDYMWRNPHPEMMVFGIFNDAQIDALMQDLRNTIHQVLDAGIYDQDFVQISQYPDDEYTKIRSQEAIDHPELRTTRCDDVVINTEDVEYHKSALLTQLGIDIRTQLHLTEGIPDPYDLFTSTVQSMLEAPEVAVFMDDEDFVTDLLETINEVVEEEYAGMGEESGFDFDDFRDNMYEAIITWINEQQ